MSELPSSAETAASTIANGGAEPWAARVGWALLDDAARADLAVLFRFIAAVRAVADHPALAPERKEAALAALAAPFGADVAPAAMDAAWMAPAQALADLLTARGIDARPAWQILQAAGQDLRKARYRDWSDLLTWCRFSAAPVGHLAAQVLAGDNAAAVKPAATLAIAVQMIEIVKRAASHYRWLGRVYLPERWFAEARGDIADLGFQRLSPSLKAVEARALDQAMALLDDTGDLEHGFATWRRRAAMAALRRELRAEIRALARGGPAAAVTMPGPFVRRVWMFRGALAGIAARGP